MTQLDRYLFRQTAFPFVLILACTTAVVWLTQILQRVDLMVEDGGSLASFLQVTIYLIPSLVAIIVPFAVLGAVLYGLNELMVDNELPVIGAAGGSQMRIARPILLLSVLAAGLGYVINADLQPRSYRALKETVTMVRSDIARSLIRSKVFTEVIEGVTIYADEVRPGDQYVGMLIHDERLPAEDRTYTAERGLFKMTAAGPRLLLVGGTAQRRKRETGAVEIIRFTETAFDLASIEREPPQRGLEAEERFVGELLNPERAEIAADESAQSLVAEGHARLATPLYSIAFAMIAAASLLTAPVSRRGYAGRLLWTIGLAIALRTAGFVAQSLASTAPALNALQYVIPAAAAIAALVIIAGRFWTVRRRDPNLGALGHAAEGRACS